jgi:hypothetical protein
LIPERFRATVGQKIMEYQYLALWLLLIITSFYFILGLRGIRSKRVVVIREKRFRLLNSFPLLVAVFFQATLNGGILVDCIVFAFLLLLLIDVFRRNKGYMFLGIDQPVFDELLLAEARKIDPRAELTQLSLYLPSTRQTLDYNYTYNSGVVHITAANSRSLPLQEVMMQKLSTYFQEHSTTVNKVFYREVTLLAVLFISIILVWIALR